MTDRDSRTRWGRVAGWERAAVGGLLGLFLLVSATALPRQSVTVDEFAHLPAGLHYWRTGDFGLYGENPPLVKLWAALPLLALPLAAETDPGRFTGGWRPWLHGADFMRRNQDRYLRAFALGRGMVLLLALALGLLLHRAARCRYGPWGGAVALALYALCPLFLAHGHLATVDAGFALLFLPAVLALVGWLERPTLPRAMTAGAALALALLAKFSALILLPFCLAAPLLQRYLFRSVPSLPRSLGRWLLHLAAMAAVTLLLVGLPYRWRGASLPLGGHLFTSTRLAGIAEGLPSLPSLLPAVWLEGLDRQLADMETGEFPNYLSGRWYRGADPRYFAVALLVKMPIPALLALLLTLVSGLIPSPRGRAFSPREAILLAVALLFLGSASLGSSLQIGLRYLLPVLPLLYLLAGRLGRLLEQPSRDRRGLAALLFLWLAFSVLTAWPDHLSYFNEAAGGPSGGHRHLLDSNLDWGQDLPALARWMEAEGVAEVELAYFGHVDPGLYGVRHLPPGEGREGGYTAVSAQHLFGAGEYPYPLLYLDPPRRLDPELILALRGEAPAGRAGRSIWIFRTRRGVSPPG
jgi:hypothetical protein